MNKSSFEQNGGTYRTVGDYSIPNITLPAEASKPLGVWGLKRKDYLMEQLKADSQMEWVARINNIEARAIEIVNTEMIYN